MLATCIGILSLIIGFLVLLLPLLLTELSRPRDAMWGAVLLTLGLILITSSDRLRGAPILGVLLGSLLVGRLGWEVSLSRWNNLTKDEQVALGSLNRWNTNVSQYSEILKNLFESFLKIFKIFASNPKASSIRKKWVRPDSNEKYQESELEIDNEKVLIEGNDDSGKTFEVPAKDNSAHKGS